MDDKIVEQFIIETFEENYNYLKEESGHALSPELKRLALDEVIYYWRKLRDVAINVTETEVKLNLPNQITPNGKKFTVEGIVDIIRGLDRTVMYDLKTHDPDYIDANIDEFKKQLNIYAHIWQNLRKEKLDETAVIATTFPSSMREVLKFEDEILIEKEFNKWEPIKHIEVNQEHVHETIRRFAETVDLIEDKKFKALELKKLNERIIKSDEKKGPKTATWLCRNCDGRFSCSSYRKFVFQSNSPKENEFKRYISDNGDEADIDERIDAAVNRAIEVERID